MKRFSFPKKKRLISNEQFKAVLARSRRSSNGLLILYMAENDCGYSRLGVSVGKSHGNAVVRNRLKRLLREVFRQSQDSIPAGFDYLLMISPRRSKKSTFDSAGPSTPLRVKKKTFMPSEDEARAKTRHSTGDLRAERRRGTKEPTFEQVRASFLELVNASDVARRPPFDSAQGEEDNLHASTGHPTVERRRGTGHEKKEFNRGKRRGRRERN